MPNTGLPLATSLLDHRHGIFAGRGRIAGAVGQQDAIGVAGQDLLGRRGGRQHGGAGADAGQGAQDVALDAIVQHHDLVLRLAGLGVALRPAPQALVEGEGLQAGGVLGEVEAHDTGPGPGPIDQGVQVEAALRIMGDHRVRHAPLADRQGQLAGVDAGQRHHAAPLQPAAQVGVGAPVGRRGRHVAEDRPARGRLRARAELLDVFEVDPDIADVREGEGHDLGHVRGVGQDLLVAAHRGVEADLAHRLADRAGAIALQDGPVRQREHAGGSGHQRLGHGGGPPRIRDDSYSRKTAGRSLAPPAAQTAAYLGGQGRAVNPAPARRERKDTPRRHPGRPERPSREPGVQAVRLPWAPALRFAAAGVTIGGDRAPSDRAHVTNPPPRASLPSNGGDA